MINLKTSLENRGSVPRRCGSLKCYRCLRICKTSEKKETEVKEQIRDAVDDIWKSEDTSAASIDETVYVILNADGTQQKIYVSDWLKNQGEKIPTPRAIPIRMLPFP